MKLTKAEEQLMDLIWKCENIFMKDIIESYPDPKPAGTTIATLLKRMQEKGFVGYRVHGNSRSYYSLVEKEKYFANQVNGMIKNHFDNSALQFASFFASATNMTKEELEDLKKIVELEIKNKR
jgi:BlaI family penicillinase repressor